jgi:hypothetical protein
MKSTKKNLSFSIIHTFQIAQNRLKLEHLASHQLSHQDAVSRIINKKIKLLYISHKLQTNCPHAMCQIVVQDLAHSLCAH